MVDDILKTTWAPKTACCCDVKNAGFLAAETKPVPAGSRGAACALALQRAVVPAVGCDCLLCTEIVNNGIKYSTYLDFTSFPPMPFALN